MELPIPIFCQDKIYTEIETKDPSPGVIADTKKMADNGKIYSSMLVFISGCITKLISSDGDVIEDNKTQIKSIVGHMSYKTAEYVAVQIIVDYDDDDDGIEGVYNCPRCHEQIISELDSDGNDGRDHVSDLEIKYMRGEDVNNDITVDLSSPVELKDANGKVLETVESVSLIIPTLDHCIKADVKYSIKDKIRFSLQVFLEATTHINGVDITSKWKSHLGMRLFENLNPKKDIKPMGLPLSIYGRNNQVEKVCPSCDKHFKATVDTSNFFVSGLQQE